MPKIVFVGAGSTVTKESEEKDLSESDNNEK